MAGFVLSEGLTIGYVMLISTGLYRVLPHLVKTGIPIQFLISPLLFLYVSAITEPEFRFTKKMILHFLPSFLSIMYLVPFFLESAEAKVAFVQRTVSPGVPSSAEEWTIWIYFQASLWVYSILSFRKYRQYRLRVREMVSNMSCYGWNWLRIFIVFIQSMLSSYLVVDVLMLKGIPWVAFYPFISVSAAGCMIFLGWRGFLRLDYLPLPPEEKIHAPLVQERSKEEWESLFDQILQATRRRALFRSSELSLPELAKTLGYSRTELSRIVNLGGKTNFCDFINKLRVEDMRHRLEAAGRNRLDILQAAFESGFNSKSAFHAAFKKWTGVTPSLYQRRVSSDS
jgi:AraC-like DNA-binding protein